MYVWTQTLSLDMHTLYFVDKPSSIINMHMPMNMHLWMFEANLLLSEVNSANVLYGITNKQKKKSWSFVHNTYLCNHIP